MLSDLTTEEVRGALAENTRKRQGELMVGVFRLLTQQPDGLPAKDVLARLRAEVPPTPFESSEYTNRPGVVRYDKIVRFTTIAFVKAGWLTKSKGQWSATDAGQAAYLRLKNRPEAFMREAVSHYQRWKKDQPDVAYVVAESEDIEEEAVEVATNLEVTTNLEEAEEAAFAEIKAFVDRMAPYDFQDLVTAVVEAMGYHVLWVAPPGPDKGVDIIAGSDQLGINDPRIKVQVKHRPSSRTDVSDLRSFMAVLGARDVGIFVSAGGFTREALSEARTHETRKLTLIDLNRLLDLWIANYTTVDESRRQLLPLRPVYYLAPARS
jgi:restriction system protein